MLEKVLEIWDGDNTITLMQMLVQNSFHLFHSIRRCSFQIYSSHYLEGKTVVGGERGI